MPQLDVMTFFTQFFWFAIGFSFFYIVILHSILPSISLTLKYRRKKLEFLTLEVNKKKENVSDLLNTYDTISYKSFNFCRIHLSKVVNSSKSWIEKTIQQIEDEDRFKQANTNYLKALGEKSFRYILFKLNLANTLNDLK